MALIAVAAAGLALYWEVRVMPAKPANQDAIRIVHVIIDRNTRDQYVAQVKAFAQSFHFALRTSQTSPDSNDVVLHMERDDVWMVSVMVSPIGGNDPVYEIYMYTKSEKPVSPMSLDPLVEGLKVFTSAVAGAVVTEKR
jgi:hypothetical protein